MLFLLLEALSGWMLFRFNDYQASIWFTQANAVCGQLLELEANVLKYVRLDALNSQLTQSNLVLQYNNQQLRRRLFELTQDSSYTQQVQAKLLADQRMIAARVITNSIRQKDNYLTINRGRLDGVRPEMGVVSGTGIVGIVYLVSDHYSLVLPILNSKSSISCRLRGTGYFGALRWAGGNPLVATLDDVPRHARCHLGDVVETSGFSRVFPEGIFVGKVVDIHNSADGLSYQLSVQLSVDLANLRDVCVITEEHRQELDSLESMRVLQAKEKKK